LCPTSISRLQRRQNKLSKASFQIANENSVLGVVWAQVGNQIP
jgi:hypothetical protein